MNRILIFACVFFLSLAHCEELENDVQPGNATNKVNATGYNVEPMSKDGEEIEVEVLNNLTLPQPPSGGIADGTAMHFAKLPRSCLGIRLNGADHRNGVYYIRDNNNLEYPAYCDMSINGGGWTLVASIHENNIRPTGRCNTGDKWSSETAYEKGQQVGADSWTNYETFGSIISATSQDYKNAAYFDLNARDIMIWQLPNDTPLRSFSSASYLQYYTSTGFLSQYGGNMFSLYKYYFPMKSGVYASIADNGPAIPVTFAEGNTADVLSHFGSTTQTYLESGYIQFRAVNSNKNVFALCPGAKMKSNNAIPQYSCIGSSADTYDSRWCGDFAGLSYDQYGTGNGYNVDSTLLHSTFLIFYR